jgi:hypothetical protein
VGSAKEDARDFADLVKRYDIEAVIYHKQCPFGSLAVYDSYSKIKASVEIPFLTIEAEQENPEKLISYFLRKIDD